MFATEVSGRTGQLSGAERSDLRTEPVLVARPLTEINLTSNRALLGEGLGARYVERVRRLAEELGQSPISRSSSRVGLAGLAQVLENSAQQNKLPRGSYQFASDELASLLAAAPSDPIVIRRPGIDLNSAAGIAESSRDAVKAYFKAWKECSRWDPDGIKINTAATPDEPGSARAIISEVREALADKGMLNREGLLGTIPATALNTGQLPVVAASMVNDALESLRPGVLERKIPYGPYKRLREVVMVLAKELGVPADTEVQLAA